MQSKNEFFKGLDMDTDLHKVEADTMRDASNIRLVDDEGHGLVSVNINGNDFRFALKPNYVPLGYCVFNSIAYIFSTDTTNPGVGEIGSYPAPDGLGNFLHDNKGNPLYKALQNWTGSLPSNPRADFNTPLFNFNVSNQIEAFARIDYDDSVNIYWTDDNNEFRVVNSGFDQTGLYNNRTYYTGSFNQINVFANSPQHPIITSMTESLGGQLLCGNYFAFIRYSTASLNKTDFLCESDAIQISLEDNPAMKIDGAPGGTQSQKKVTLNLSNLDPSYTYFEIAIVYYNNGTATTYLIDNLYNVAATILSGNVTITGTEGQITFTLAEIVTRKNSFNVPKTCTQLENRAWLGNVKQSNQLTQALITFANAIKISYDDTLTIPDKPMDTSDVITANGQYKYYQNTYSDVGYFRGETYPFAIVYVFTDGTESDAIQCKGEDDWTGANSGVKVNTSGIYRFPNNSVSNFRTTTNAGTGAGNLNILGVKFDWTGLIVPPGIIGWYFVRSQRKPNLIYQGIVLPTWKAASSAPTAVSDPWPHIDLGDFTTVLTGDTFYNNPNSIPLFDLYVPMFFKFTPTIGPANGRNIIDYSVGEVQVEDTTRKGFYSPDHFFAQSLIDQSYVMYNICTVKMPNINFNSNGNLAVQSPLRAIDFMFETTDMDFSTYTLVPSGPVSAYNIAGFTPSPNPGNSFVSSFDGGGNASNPNTFLVSTGSNLIQGSCVYFNRQFCTNNYIGLVGSDTQFPWDNGSVNPDHNDYSLSNIYSTDPDPSVYDITTLYDIKTLSYFKISQFIARAQVITHQTCYSGDCFLQRTYTKQLYNLDNYDGDGSSADSRSVFPADGIIFSIVTENNINTAMRNADSTNIYYPKIGLNGGLNSQNFYAMASDNNKVEATQINLGYNQTLSGFFYEGFDPTLPFQENKFPTRIYFSNFHPNGSFTDYYRIFDLAAYQDYDYRLGEIIKIEDFHSRLVSIQQSGINFHLINERAMLSPGASAGQLLIGTGDVLSPKAQTVSDVYGSQHQWSIIKTDYSIYGVDYNKRKIWRLKPSGEFENISDTKKVKSWINNLFIAAGNPESSIMNIFPDNPVNVLKGGIVAGYDRKYGDVIFTINGYLTRTEIQLDTNVIIKTLVKDSMCFSEIMDEFTNRPQYNSPFYLSLNNDFFSVNPITDVNRISDTIEQSFYVHDVELIGATPNRQTFYSELQKSFIKFTHNENSDFEKIYEHLEISSGGDEFSNIIYDTEEQHSDNLTFRQPNALWIDPRFRENFWLVSVPRATSVNTTTNNPDQVQSVMRGKYLSVYLEFNQAVKQYAKSVLTSFRISH